MQLSSFSEVEPVYEPPPPSFGFGFGLGGGAGPQQPEVVVKQAGPSQSFGWLGHGRSININSLLIPNPFPDTMNVNTKWVPAVDHSMEPLVHLSEHTAHTAHIEHAPREEHRYVIRSSLSRRLSHNSQCFPTFSSEPAPAPIRATPAPEARPPVPTYAPVPEPPAPSYAPRPVRKATSSGNYHTQSGAGYRFGTNPSKAR